MWSNKIYICFIIAFVGLASCDSFKKVQSNKEDTTNKEKEQLDEIEGKRVYNPETGEYEVVTDVTGELEEVEWTDATKEEVPPIGSEATDRLGLPGTELPEDTLFSEIEGMQLPSYNMVLALPFLTNQFTSFDEDISPKSQPAINFYEGAKMAFEVLSNENVNLDVHVLDTKASEVDTRGLMYNQAVQNAHIIIGAFRNSTAKVMAEYALNNQKPFVSPYYPHNALVEENPFFIQLNPSIFTHCDALIRYLKTRYADDQIVLIGRETRREKGILNLYQKAHYKYSGTSAIAPLKEVIITDKTSSLEETILKEHFVKDRPTIFVIASSQESFVYSILRKIDIEKKNYDEDNEDLLLDADELIVFGQPRWKNFTKISYDYYEKLKLHITSDSHIDPNQAIIQAFKQNFFDKYGTLPTEAAYKGFDTILYFGRLLNQQGTGFINTIDQYPHKGLQNNFEINRTITKQRPLDDATLNNFDQLENTYVHILAFQNYQFVVAK